MAFLPLLLAASLGAVDVAPIPAAAPSADARVEIARRWDATGHRAMAAVAYDRLRPATRQRVDALLRAHPDLARLSEGVDASTPAGIREVFLRASVWADRIRNDPRFYRENVQRPTPTPLLAATPKLAAVAAGPLGKARRGGENE